jgi:hypothetical protein
MQQSAKLTNIEALREAKAALIDFADKVRAALTEANADVMRTTARLKGECLSHWQREVKKWTNKLAQAKAELFRAQIQSGEDRPSAIVEKKAVDAAQRKIDEAQHKIERIRHWSRALERDILLFKGQCQQIDRAAEADIPRAVAMLERMTESIDSYLRVKAPMRVGDESRKEGKPIAGVPGEAPRLRDAPEEQVEAKPDTLANDAEGDHT